MSGRRRRPTVVRSPAMTRPASTPPPREPRASDSPPRLWREMSVVLLTGLIARAVVLAVLPPKAMSYDLRAWLEIAGALANGQNPYTIPQHFLSWPPAWMQIVFFLDGVARFCDLPLSVVIRGFLILADATGAWLAGRLIRRIAPVSVLWPMLVVWSLNPVAIFLVCQHGNFDGLVAICVLLLLLSTIDFIEREDPVSWLWACGWLGAGVVLKTIPLALAPLLAVGRGLSRKTVALGAALAAGPALYGVSIIYALSPDQVRARVLGYQGIAGFFGISGLLTIAGRRAWMPIYRGLFAVLVVAGMAWLAIHLRRSATPRGCVLAAAAILIAIPALGPGYGAQYLAWSLPLLVVLWAIGNRRTRIALAVFWAVAVPTYLVDYALMSSHGAFLRTTTTLPPSLMRLSLALGTPEGATLERLPLFAAYVVLVAVLARETRRELDGSPSLRHHGS